MISCMEMRTSVFNSSLCVCVCVGWLVDPTLWGHRLQYPKSLTFFGPHEENGLHK